MNKLALTAGFALCVLAGAANAEFLQFYKGNAASVPFDGANAQCPIGRSCADDVLAPTLQYSTSAGTLTVSASTRVNSIIGDGTVPANVVQDIRPNFGGLGVNTLAPGLDLLPIPLNVSDLAGLRSGLPPISLPSLNPGGDSIGATQLGPFVEARETLDLSFEQPVNLSSIIFWDENHGQPINFKGGTFDLLVDGVRIFNNQSLVNVFDTSLTGTSFAFRPGSFGADFNESFYVGGVRISAVPLPGTLALFGVALAGMAIARRRG